MFQRVLKIIIRRVSNFIYRTSDSLLLLLIMYD